MRYPYVNVGRLQEIIEDQAYTIEHLEEDRDWWKGEAEELRDALDDLRKKIEEGAALEHITAEELVELREKVAGAEMGTWSVRWQNERIVVGIEEDRFLPVALIEGPPHVWCGNADLIAHAHNALPRLLDEIDRLHEENARLRNELEWADLDRG
jgi:hypothetical protein